MHTNRPLFTWIEYYNATSSTLPPQATGLVSLNGHTLRKKNPSLDHTLQKKTQPHPTTREGIFYCSFFFFFLLLIARTFFPPPHSQLLRLILLLPAPGTTKMGFKSGFPPVGRDGARVFARTQLRTLLHNLAIKSELSAGRKKLCLPTPAKMIMGEFRSLARTIARGSHANRDVDQPAGHTGEHVFVRLGKFLVYDLD